MMMILSHSLSASHHSNSPVRSPASSRETSIPSTLVHSSSPKPNDTHLQRPDPPDPHLEPALDALDVVELDALPPAAPGGLAPEQQQLLGHADRVAADVVAADVAAQPRQRQAADDGLVGLPCAVTPSVIAVEATASLC